MPSDQAQTIALALLIGGVAIFAVAIACLLRLAHRGEGTPDPHDERHLGDYPKVPEFKPWRDAE